MTPAKTTEKIRRQSVVAEIKPATGTRSAPGLALEDTPLGGRLVDTGGLAKENRITRRSPIISVKEIDVEVKRWSKKA